MIRDEVGRVGEDLIRASLDEVLDDVVMSQISAQITAVLSGQLPQLVAAKHAVGSVRRLLDLMRSGGF
jgi:hypothetical protein